MEAAEYSNEWNETYSIDSIDTGYGEPLTLSTDDGASLPASDDSYSEGSLFDYEDGVGSYDSNAYAEYLAEAAVTGGSSVSTANSEGSAESTATASSATPSNDTETEPDTSGSTTQSESTTQQSTASDGELAADSVTENQHDDGGTDEIDAPPPILPPDDLALAIPTLALEASLDDLFSVTAPGTSSYSSTSVTTAAPVSKPITGELTGTTETTGSSTVTTSLVYTSPSDWLFTESKSTDWTTSESTVDSDGVAFGVEMASGVSMTITVSSTGTTSVTRGEYENVTRSTGESWDNSDPPDNLVDTGWFDGTITSFRTTSVSTTETLTTVGGVPAVTLTLSAASSTGNSFSVSGGFNYSKLVGTLNSFGNGNTAVYSSSGNGEQTTGFARLSMNSSHSTSAAYTVQATVPVGGDFDEADVSGTVTTNTTSTSGASSSLGFSHDSQSFSGDVAAETDEYDYFSVGFNDGYGGGAWHIVDVTADLTDIDNSIDSPTYSPSEPSGLTPPPAVPVPPTVISTPLVTPPPVTPSGTGATLNIGRSSGGGGGGWIDLADKDRQSIQEGAVSTDIVELLEVSANGSGGGGSSFELTGSGAAPDLVIKSNSGSGGGHTVVADNTTTTEDPEGFYVPEGSGHTSHQTIVDFDVYSETYTSSGGFNYTLTVPLGNPDNFKIEDLGLTGDWNGTVTIDVKHKDYYTEHSRAWDENGVLYFEAEGRWGSIWVGQHAMIGTAGKITHTSLPWHEMENVNFYTDAGQLPAPPTLGLTPQQEDEAFLDDLQSKLDYFGMVPVIGEVADILNAGIHLGRGNLAEAGVSIISMVPGGDAAKLAKIGSGKLASVGNKLRNKFEKISGAAKKVQNKCSGSTCFIAGTQVVVAADTDIDQVAIAMPEELLVEPTVEDNSSSTAAFLGAGVAIALTRHNLKTRRHRRRLLSRKPNSSE